MKKMKLSKSEVRAAKKAVSTRLGAGAKPVARTPKNAKSVPVAVKGDAKAALGRVAKDLWSILGVPVSVAPDAKIGRRTVRRLAQLAISAWGTQLKSREGRQR